MDKNFNKILIAIKNFDNDFVKNEVLKNPELIKKVGPFGEDLIRRCATSNNKEIFDFLVKIDPEIINNKTGYFKCKFEINSNIYFSSCQGNIFVLRDYWDCLAKNDNFLDSLSVCLEYCIENEYEDILDFIFDKKEFIDNLAIENGHRDIFEESFRVCLENNNPNILEKFLNKGFYREDMINIVIKNGCYELIPSLVCCGNFDFLGTDGKTPLMNLIKKMSYKNEISKTEILKILIANSNCNIRSNTGKVALMYFNRKFSKTMFYEMVLQKTDVEIKDKDGNNSLFYMEKNKDEDLEDSLFD